jgi:hypothetical protein
VALLSREQVSQVVSNRAYRLEYALIHESDESDEEFGPDPTKKDHARRGRSTAAGRRIGTVHRPQNISTNQRNYGRRSRGLPS